MWIAFETMLACTATLWWLLAIALFLMTHAAHSCHLSCLEEQSRTYKPRLPTTTGLPPSVLKAAAGEIQLLCQHGMSHAATSLCQAAQCLAECLPGEMKKVRHSFLSRVTSLISLVMLTSRPATGGTLRKSRILKKERCRHVFKENVGTLSIKVHIFNINLLLLSMHISHTLNLYYKPLINVISCNY